MTVGATGFHLDGEDRPSSILQRAQARVAAPAVAGELEKILAGADDAARAAGQDEARLWGKHFRAAADLAGRVHDRRQPVALRDAIAGLDVVEDRAGPGRGHHVDVFERYDRSGKFLEFRD